MLQNFMEVCVCAFKKQLLVNKTMLLLFSIGFLLLFSPEWIYFLYKVRSP